MSRQEKPPPVKALVTKAPVTRAYLAGIDFEAMLEEDVRLMEASRQRAERARRRIAARRKAGKKLPQAPDPAATE